MIRSMPNMLCSKVHELLSYCLFNKNDIILGKNKMIASGYNKEKIVKKTKSLFDGRSGNT